MIIILIALAVVTFFYKTYIATTVIAILVAVLIAFLRYNINPAKIFMGDSGAFAIGGLLSSLLFILNMRIGIIIPFIVLFIIFIAEIGSVALQLISKKIRKRKIRTVAPLHHHYEKTGLAETHIVMKAWLIQGIVAAVTIITLFYEFNMKLLP